MKRKLRRAIYFAGCSLVALFGVIGTLATVCAIRGNLPAIPVVVISFTLALFAAGFLEAMDRREERS